MLLHDLLKGLNILNIIGDINKVDIKNVSDDSRNLKKDGIFVAIKGLHTDSHVFIDVVIKNGIKAIVLEKMPESYKDNVTYIQVEDSREALGIIASNFYQNPSKKMKIIGVTGTKGKTTTVYMIYHILKNLNKKAGMVSSIDAIIGDKKYDTGFHVSNPEPLALHHFLKDMADENCKYAVLEVTSHGIHQKRIAGIDFEVTVLTNIAPEHLDYHKTFPEYKKVKMSFLKKGRKRVPAAKTTKLKLFPGEFNNLNAEAAIQAVLYLGINKSNAISSLKSFKFPEGRLEEINEGQDFDVFIDFAHTPDSLEAALKYLKSITKNKLISVFGSAGERDHQKRPKMGAVAAKYSDVIVLTSEDPRSEDIGSIVEEIALGISTKNYIFLDYGQFRESIHDIGKKVVFKIYDREKAIKFALTQLAEKGDLVVFFGKGHEKSMNLDGNHETPWSEHSVVKKYLRKK